MSIIFHISCSVQFRIWACNETSALIQSSHKYLIKGRRLDCVCSFTLLRFLPVGIHCVELLQIILIHWNAAQTMEEEKSHNIRAILSCSSNLCNVKSFTSKLFRMRWSVCGWNGECSEMISWPREKFCVKLNQLWLEWASIKVSRKIHSLFYSDEEWKLQTTIFMFFVFWFLEKNHSSSDATSHEKNRTCSEQEWKNKVFCYFKDFSFG